jgi:hypothetical protein
MWMGCYTLDLYCECVGATRDFKQDSTGLHDALGHAWGEFPHQYTGESGAECRARARKAGWIIKLDGTAICPKCSNKVNPYNAK